MEKRIHLDEAIRREAAGFGGARRARPFVWAFDNRLSDRGSFFAASPIWESCPLAMMNNVNVQLIRDLPFATLSQLARYLDAQGQRNWRNLIEKMPPKTYNPNDVEMFALSALRPGGSPSFDLLKDMGFRGNTVRQLVSYLQKLEHEPALLLLQQEGETFSKGL